MDIDDLETQQINDIVNKVVHSETDSIEYYVCKWCGAKSYSILVEHKDGCRVEQ